MLLTDVFPHTILPKNCFPAVACSVFHIYTIYKLCNREERYHSEVERERGRTRWALRRQFCIWRDDRNCCEVVIILLRKQSWIRNAIFFPKQIQLLVRAWKKRKRGKFLSPSIWYFLAYAFIFYSVSFSYFHWLNLLDSIVFHILGHYGFERLSCFGTI